MARIPPDGCLLPERFLAKVVLEDRGYETPCWIWTAYRNRDGYGRFSLGSRAEGNALAYKYAYEVVVGPVPEGLTLDHLCRVRECANPYHLEPVPHLENVRRGRRNQYADATSCIHGHDFTAENTRLERDGTRVCISCARARQRRYEGLAA